MNYQETAERNFLKVFFTFILLMLLSAFFGSLMAQPEQVNGEKFRKHFPEKEKTVYLEFDDHRVSGTELRILTFDHKKGGCSVYKTYDVEWLDEKNVVLVEGNRWYVQRDFTREALIIRIKGVETVYKRAPLKDDTEFECRTRRE